MNEATAILDRLEQIAGENFSPIWEQMIQREITGGAIALGVGIMFLLTAIVFVIVGLTHRDNYLNDCCWCYPVAIGCFIFGLMLTICSINPLLYPEAEALRNLLS